MRKPELLAPAGDLEKLRTAVTYGADAVCLGGQSFSIRAGAGDFDAAQLIEGLYHAHRKGVRVYVPVNIFARNGDLPTVEEYVRWLAAAGVDAVILSDPGILGLTRRVAPELAVHISAQANTSNWAAADFWQKQGAARVVLPRELSLTEIAGIGEKTAIGLEAFIHGTMCMDWSGRGLLSSCLTGRGDCAQTCHLMDEQRPGKCLPVAEDGRGSIFNSCDLCMLPYLPALAEAGVGSFKIEGMMKSIHYLATVVNAYRANIDAWWEQKEEYRLAPAWLDELAQASHRPWSSGFYFGNPAAEGRPAESTAYQRPAAFVAVVRDWRGGRLWLEQRGHFARGQELEMIIPGSLPLSLQVDELYDRQGEPIERASHTRQLLQVPLSRPVPLHTVVRRREK